MFSVINGGAPFVSLPEEKEACKLELQNRIGVVTEFVKKLALDAGIPREKIDSLQVAPAKSFSVLDAAMVDGATVELPAYFFIDFGKDFGIKDEDELDNAYQRINHIFDWEGPEYCSIHIFRHLVLAHKMSQDKDRALNSARFVTLHELGHCLQYDEGVYHVPLKYKIGGFSLILGVGLLVTAALVKFVVIPIFATAMPLILTVPLVILIGTVAFFALKTFAEHIRSRFVFHQREIDADRFAATALKGEEGKNVRLGGMFFFLLCRALSNSDSSSTHPLPDDRIKLLREVSLEQQRHMA
jgi:hypothetical protein